MNVKLTANDAQEVWHKLGVMAETPELCEGYGLTVEQVESVIDGLPKQGGEWTVPEFATEAVKNEMQDHAKILRAIADDNRGCQKDTGRPMVIARELTKKFETIFS